MSTNQRAAKKGPIGSGNYVVKQGDCMSKIAVETGFFWDTLWNLPENQELKSRRGDPNILLPGDKVFIPEIRKKSESGATDTSYRFVRKGVPSKLRLQIQKFGKVRAKDSYLLDIDGALSNGTLDEDGFLEVPIPGKAKKGRLIVGNDKQTFEFDLGGIDPLEETSGIQGRLNNLGYGAGVPDGILGPATQLAIRRFQKDQRLPETGEPNDATLAKLQEVHGS